GWQAGTGGPAPGTSTRRRGGFLASLRLAVSGGGTAGPAARTMRVGQVNAPQGGQGSTGSRHCPERTASRIARSYFHTSPPLAGRVPWVTRWRSIVSV